METSCSEVEERSVYFDPVDFMPNGSEHNLRNVVLQRGRQRSLWQQHDYPRTGTQNRRFLISWYEEHSWLEYSEKADAAFCFFCRLLNSEVKVMILK